MYAIIVSITLGMKADAQIILLQLNILKPSRIPNGIRLNNAMNPFQRASKNIKYALELAKKRNPIPSNTDERTMLTIGPAIDIFAISSKRADPEIITAPGAIILKKGENTETKVRIAPHKVKRNSAHNP